jgi:hypothetical protein
MGHSRHLGCALRCGRTGRARAGWHSRNGIPDSGIPMKIGVSGAVPGNIETNLPGGEPKCKKKFDGSTGRTR